MSDSANGNTNGTNGSPEVFAGASSVTLTDLAGRLGVSLPRLQRLLKRPEFVRHVRKGQRKTATGTRTVTLVSVSVLEALEQAVREAETEQKHYRGAAIVSEVSVSEVSDDERARAMVAIVLHQTEARIAELSAALSDVRGERNRLLMERERERLRIEALEFEVWELRSIAAKNQARAEPMPDASGDPGRLTESGDTGQSGVDIPAGSPAVDSEPLPPVRRSWLDRLLSR